MIPIDHSYVPTVLIVEDDALIRLVSQEMLEDRGFRVETACDADEALRILSSDRAIDALFTDIDMPGSMNGIELAHLVRNEWPHMAIVVASGYIRKVHGPLPDGAAFFAKPYDISAVVARLHQGIDARPRVLVSRTMSMDDEGPAARLVQVYGSSSDAASSRSDTSA
jgi:CheY-like chemotaxis protein